MEAGKTLDQQLYLPEGSLAIKDEHFAFPGRFTMTSVNESELVAIVENSVRMALDDLCFALAQGRSPEADRRRFSGALAEGVARAIAKALGGGSGGGDEARRTVRLT